MNNQDIIQKTEQFVKEKLLGEGTGHDWWHIYRVWKSALHIQQQEGGDLLIIELGALLHDIADWKFHDGDETVGPRVAREWLESVEVDESVISKVCHIIEAVSFKGAGVENKMETMEGKIVQDADRLDALGAIGIARTFAYGGSKGRELYNPEIKPELHATAEQYKKNNSPTLNHFYEKLLLLKDLMNTETGRALAQNRHEYMERYIVQFLEEWEGKK